MSAPLAVLLGLLLLPGLGSAAEASKEPAKVKIRSKKGEGQTGALLAPDTGLIDVPTAAVLDYGGYAVRSRFFTGGGFLQYVNFGVYQRVNLGASLTLDGLIGSERNVRLRAPNLQVKFRFYDGERRLPALAVGFDGQGYIYNQADRRYNHRQRGLYLVGTQELGLPGLEVHPSVNISDFDENLFFGAIPISYNIQDKAALLFEWDNVNNFTDSRANAGLRVYVTPKLHLDFAVRSIGQGGRFPGGGSRGPERIAQIKYSSSF